MQIETRSIINSRRQLSLLCLLSVINSLRLQLPSSGWDGEGAVQSRCLLPASMTGASVLANRVYGLSLKCFSCEALRSDSARQGFLSIWNSFTEFRVKNGCLMWDGRPHCWGKHVFKLIPITEHGVWVIYILYPSTLCLWPFCAPLGC